MLPGTPYVRLSENHLGHLNYFMQKSRSLVITNEGAFRFVGFIMLGFWKEHAYASYISPATARFF
jgi:hypothetical protein